VNKDVITYQSYDNGKSGNIEGIDIHVMTRMIHHSPNFMCNFLRTVWFVRDRSVVNYRLATVTFFLLLLLFSDRIFNPMSSSTKPPVLNNNNNNKILSFL
jgi:hypothetical protein